MAYTSINECNRIVIAFLLHPEFGSILGSIFLPIWLFDLFKFLWFERPSRPNVEEADEEIFNYRLHFHLPTF